MSDTLLRSRLIRLAATHPEFRKDLLPILKSACACDEVADDGASKTPKEASHKKNAGTRIIRKVLATFIRVISVKSESDTGNRAVTGIMQVDLGQKEPILPLKFIASVSPSGMVLGFTSARATTGAGAEALTGVWKGLFQEAVTSGILDSYAGVAEALPEANMHMASAKKAGDFAPASIGKEVSGPTGEKDSDAGKPWAKGHFKQDQFSELAKKQKDGILDDGKADPAGKTAGCEKLPEGGMRDNCEAKKEEGAENEKEDAKKEAALRKGLIRLAAMHPEFRADLLPLLK